MALIGIQEKGSLKKETIVTLADIPCCSSIEDGSFQMLSMIDKIHHLYEDSSEDLKKVFAVRSSVKYNRAVILQCILV